MFEPLFCCLSVINIYNFQLKLRKTLSTSICYNYSYLIVEAVFRGGMLIYKPLDFFFRANQAVALLTHFL